MPENYIKDFVEYFYEYNKVRMFDISFVLFYLSGLGKFVIKPFKFYYKKKKLKELIEKFEHRRDDRGIMIRNELIKRYNDFEKALVDVDNLFQYKQKRMYKALRNEKIKIDLEK